MKVVRWILAAFSMYTRIPVPHFKAEEEDMEHCITFLPLVGAVIAAIMFGIIRLLSYYPVPIPARVAVALIVPLTVTGGFHLDGFMDTVDALSSYRSKEERLAILSDPHVGAFAFIKLITAGLFAYAGLLIIMDIDTGNKDRLFILVCGSVIISRTIAALTSIMMKKAKKDGLLVKETKEIGGAPVAFLILVLTAILCLMAYIDPVKTGVIMLAYLVYTIIYRNKVKKNFGGITGDTTGYYITVSQIVAICALAVITLITTG